MKAKEFVKKKYPKAIIERRRSGMCQGTYYGEPFWMIKMDFEGEIIGVGNSKSNAWVNTKKFIQAEEIRIAEFKAAGEKSCKTKVSYEHF